jgi:putative adenylate-forming enzyme
MNPALVHAALAFWRTRRLAGALRTREDVLRRRESSLHRFLARKAPRVPFYAAQGGQRLEDLPVLDKAVVQANFERFNTAGVTLAEARAALDAGEDRVRGLVVGQSTGTSGNRGVFVISEVERFTWLGVILAKTLPDILTRRHKVALALPTFSRLYASAGDTGRLQLRFFDLALGLDAWRADLVAYAPDTIVAPPKILRALAETTDIRPAHVFSGAEVLDPIDRSIIEARFGERVREIYMATEGLFGVSCREGVLHLAEDVVAFEWETVPGSPDLKSPLITDFTRSTQIMARYRMNDLLRLSDAPCPCGSPLQRVAAIEGRQDDVFELKGSTTLPVPVTPDVLRNAIVDADRRILDFRVTQTAADRIELSLAADLPADGAEAALAALRRALARIGAADVAIDLRRGIPSTTERKLRRVRRDWRRPG